MRQKIKSFAGIAVCIFIGIAPIVYADWFSRKENQKSAAERLEEINLRKEEALNSGEQGMSNMFEDIYNYFNKTP